MATWDTGRVRSSVWWSAVIPVRVILTELILAVGLALLAANVLAWVRLRREDNWPPRRSSRATRPGANAAVPSRARILTGIVAGLFVTLVALATFVTRSYSL